MPEKNEQRRHNERWLAQRLACAVSVFEQMKDDETAESLFSPILKDFHSTRAANCGHIVRLLLNQWSSDSYESQMLDVLKQSPAYEVALMQIRHSLGYTDKPTEAAA